MKLKQQIVGLDALRFVAALLVVAFHLCFLHGSNGPGAIATPGYDLFKPFTFFGWIGVEIFFVLSGFVITYSAQDVTARLFFRHRLVRLLPGVLICGTITAIVLYLRTSASVHDLSLAWLRSVTFFPKGPWIDNSYWTLSIEVAFYGIVFLLLYLNRMRHLQLVIGAVGVVSSLFWIFSMWPGNVLGKRILYSIVGSDVRNVLLLRHGCYFTIGVLLWLCLFQGITKTRVMLLALCTVGGILQIVFRTGAVNRYAAYAFSAVLPITVWLFALAFIVFSVMKNNTIVRAIGPRGIGFLRRVGLMTYPLYLLHAEAGLALDATLRRYFQPRVALGTSLAIILAMTYLISVYAEPALQGQIRNLLNRIFHEDARSKARVEVSRKEFV